MLHQSIHEYRVVDRWDQHMQQIRRAEKDGASPSDSPEEEAGGRDVASPVPPAVGQLASDINTNFEDPGLWPNWWSMLEEADFVGAFPGA